MAMPKPNTCGAQKAMEIEGMAMHKKAPKLAADAMPRVNGVAKSFRKMLWRMSPAIAKEPPASHARSARGNRRKKICSVNSAAPKKGAIAKQIREQAPIMKTFCVGAIISWARVLAENFAKIEKRHQKKLFL